MPCILRPRSLWLWELISWVGRLYRWNELKWRIYIINIYVIYNIHISISHITLCFACFPQSFLGFWSVIGGCPLGNRQASTASLADSRQNVLVCSMRKRRQWRGGALYGECGRWRYGLGVAPSQWQWANEGLGWDPLKMKQSWWSLLLGHTQDIVYWHVLTVTSNG